MEKAFILVSELRTKFNCEVTITFKHDGTIEMSTSLENSPTVVANDVMLSITSLESALKSLNDSLDKSEKAIEYSEINSHFLSLSEEYEAKDYDMSDVFSVFEYIKLLIIRSNVKKIKLNGYTTGCGKTFDFDTSGFDFDFTTLNNSFKSFELNDMITFYDGEYDISCDAKTWLENDLFDVYNATLSTPCHFNKVLLPNGRFVFEQTIVDTTLQKDYCEFTDKYNSGNLSLETVPNHLLFKTMTINF